ncbi:hypothetical protein BIV25_26280 [Streptomyces sp. MUSC 14]|uniref:hypothetical protein n=1 Tax=Streptomyces sp. MUSC 14 TaxID=1354889 RepID=UPI0008F5883A|nr:hypothetical protein [Streptomyces sp. MUSC 14]OIJ92869.1 hypothetical protein BIV25_26280 [Streptomyces sp. MUSC 14]
MGIIAFMGLVCFGLLMIGADCVCLRDEDYRSLARRFRAVKERLTNPGWSLSPASGMAPTAMRAVPAGQEGMADG